MLTDLRTTLAEDRHYVHAHVRRVCNRFGIRRGDVREDDLVSETDDFLLRRYNLQAFDPTRYPRLPDEPEGVWQARVLRKLRAHAGISIVRHLQHFLERESRGASRSMAGWDFTDTPAREETDPTEQAEARASLQKLLTHLDTSDSPYTLTLTRAIRAALRGDDGTAILESAGERVRRILNWVRRRYSGVVETTEILA